MKVMREFQGYRNFLLPQGSSQATNTTCPMQSETLREGILRSPNLQPQFLQLLPIDCTGCIDHHIAPRVRFGERDELEDVAAPAEEAHPAIESEGRTIVRGMRRTQAPQ